MIASDRLPFLTMAPVQDRADRRILLLHSDALPSEALDDLHSCAEGVVIDHLTDSEDAGAHVLIYLHAGLASTKGTSLTSVRSFLSNLDLLVPLEARRSLHAIYAVHVSFLTRAHIFAAAHTSNCVEDYGRLEYLDLLEDLEQRLGVDCTMLGLRPVDFEYDAVMRSWVGRMVEAVDAMEGKEKLIVDPSKPLIDISAISLDTADEPLTPDEHPPRALEEPW